MGLLLVTYILQEKKHRQKFTGHWHRSGRSEANYLEWSVKEHLIAGSNKNVLRWEVKEEWLTLAERWARTGSNAMSSSLYFSKLSHTKRLQHIVVQAHI